MLPLARALLKKKGHGRCRGAVEAALVLGLEAPMFQGLPVLGAADAHDGSHGVADDLLALVPTIWTLLSERRNGGQDEAGVQLLQSIVVQIQGGHVAGLEALHHHIRGPGQLAKNPPPLHGLDVSGSRPSCSG